MIRTFTVLNFLASALGLGRTVTPTAPPKLNLRNDLFRQRSSGNRHKLFVVPLGGGMKEVERRRRQLERGIIHVSRPAASAASMGAVAGS